jgi:sRNA-binding regulator protein Hfq
MKKLLTTVFFACAMVVAFAADKIFLHGGRIIDGDVVKVEEFTVVYKYTGENAEQTIGKKAIEKIQYSSGRTEQMSEKMVVTSKEDWEKVEILLDKSEIVGLKKVGEVKGKNFAAYSGARADKKANKKLLEAAAEMGCAFIYLVTDTQTGTRGGYGGWGGWGAGSSQSLKKGIAYTYEDAGQ